MTSFSSIAGRAVLVGIAVCLMQSPGKAVSQESGTVGIAAAAPTPDSRLACPSDAQVDEAVKLIRAAYEKAYETAKDTGEPDPLIEQLTALADQAADPAKKYALLLEAEAIATQYESYSTALDLLEKRAQQFRIDGLKLRSQLLKRLAGPKVAADLVLFDQASDTAEKAMQAERFDVASEAAALAASVAKAIDREQKAEAKKRGRSAGKAGKDESGPTPVGPGLVKKATAFQSRVTIAQKLFVEYGEALTQLKSQPDDAAANSVVAKYLCFVRGEWQKGLPALAKSDIEGLKNVAAKEIALSRDAKRDTKRVFELAGAWWAASESKGLTDDQESAVKDHAAVFYADVAEGLSDVLEKQLAKSRLRGHATKSYSAGGQVVFLSDLPEIDPVVGFGEFGKKGQTGHWGWKIMVNNEYSPQGISTHCKEGAEAGVTYSVPANASKLIGKAALHDRGEPDGAKSPVSFKIISDGGKVLWSSPRAITHSNEAMPFEVGVTGLKSIRLIATCVGSQHNATAVWCEPRFIVDSSRTTQSAEEKVVYLSDLPERDAVVGVGEFGKNGNCGYFNRQIRGNGIFAAKGISTHCKEGAPVGVTYEVPAGARRFVAAVAITDDIDGRKSCDSPITFQVLGQDGSLLWTSPNPVRHIDDIRLCDISVIKAKTIRLEARCAGSPHWCSAVWLNPCFVFSDEGLPDALKPWSR